MTTVIGNKIKKLLAHADSTTNPEEADTFLRKAHELMREHGIELMDLGRLDQDDPVGKDRDVYRSNTNDPWRFHLGGAVARFYGCDITGTNGQNNYWTVYGRESARITFQLMYPYIDRQVLQLAREAVKRGEYRGIPKARTAIATALVYRINRMVRDRKSSETVHDKEVSNALVPVNEIEKLMGKTRKVSMRSKMDYNAQSLAEKVNLDDQLDGRKSEQRRIAG